MIVTFSRAAQFNCFSLQIDLINKSTYRYNLISLLNQDRVKMNHQHGGKRQGAGRKAQYAESTTTMRVPASRVVEIKAYLQATRSNTSTYHSHDLANITPIAAHSQLQIPVALEKIAAGFPSPAQDNIDKAIDMNEHLIKNQVATFVVKVASWSMRDAGIDADDELVVDRSLAAKHRDIVVALIDNEFTVKRLMIEGELRWLKAENPDYDDIYLSDQQELLIWGVVTFILKSVRSQR